MSKNEYKELVGFLGIKFDQIDQRFDQIDRRFEKIEGILDTHTEQINTLYNSVDFLTKVSLDNNKELKVLGYRMDRLEGWVKAAAPVVGIKFST